MKKAKRTGLFLIFQTNFFKVIPTLLFTFVFQCSPPEINNLCDPNSKQGTDFLVRNAINGENSIYCWDPFFKLAANTNEILSFSFKDTVNHLSRSYEAKIDGTNITVHLPYSIVNSAIPTFTTNAYTVFLNNVSQVSSVTENDFTSSVTYHVTAANGKKKYYTVTITPIFPLADSGQTGCWDAAGNPQSCVSSGHDGAYDNTPNARIFSNPISSSNYPNDYTTRNQLTGLLWKTCSEGTSGLTCSNGTASTQSWTASDNLCTSLNSANSGAGFAGKKGWRLPTIIELSSLKNHQNTSPTIDLAFFPGTAGSGYWSGTANPVTVGNYQYLNFLNTTIGDFAEATLGYTRCVSGNSPPSLSYTDNGDSTITDNRTGLLWQKCSDGLSDSSCSTGGASTPIWSTAVTSCNSLTTAGKSWRLPNAIELHSLFDHHGTATPYINSVFPNTVSTQYWTSTTFAAGTTSGVLVYFNTGSVSNLTKANVKPIRCVAN